ncbi:MAG: biotin--[acetyl-CoA-carboxylase] ligase [Firmicutes bacterium]|nr:biotin--[acetyl-CoA-carboxylase] ligase [Bacillota bacterium]
MAVLKSKILSRFLGCSSLTGGQLENEFGVSRQAISCAVSELKQEGFNIVSHPRVGYEFIDDGDVLASEVIKLNLHTKTLGRDTLEVLKSVDSTNVHIRRSNKETHGTVVVASEQTNGMGRKGRSFHSGKGGLYMSVSLKPNISPLRLHFLTIATAVAACEALRQVCGFNADIKWVNDIFYGGKKLCGISTDASFSAELLELKSVVLGIGINMRPVDVTLCDHAISIEEIVGNGKFRNKLVASLLNNLESAIKELEQSEKEILTEYKKRVFIFNKPITVFEGNDEYLAIARDIDDNGALVIEDSTGKMRSISAAEVSIRV